LAQDSLEEPALSVAGFQLWIHGREFPDSIDYDDGNWLHVTARCDAVGASTWIQGPVLMVTDIESFRTQCQELLAGETAVATLDPLEPEIKIKIEAIDQLGHLRLRVEMTADHLTQDHRIDFDIDQSYLPGIIKQCSAIIKEFPVRGRP
jgi:hypothetical protein